MRDFKGKAVLVTGGARGLGRAIGEAYAEAGAAVALVDIEGEAVSAAATALQEQGHRALGLQGDVGDPEVTGRVVGDTLRALGELDVLVNNVAIADEGGVLDIEPDTWKRIVDVNLGSICSVRRRRPATGWSASEGVASSTSAPSTRSFPFRIGSATA